MLRKSKNNQTMKHTESFRIRSRDTDLNGVVRASAALAYLQETAMLQHSKYGPSYDMLYSIEKTFVLSRVNMRLYRPLYVSDEITVESWACESRGVSFNRCGRIIKDGMTAAELTSVWALIDTKTKDILRTTDIEFGFGIDEPLELDLASRIKIPKGIQFGLLGEHTAGYSDVDKNGHINNTVYPDLLCNQMPSMKDRQVTALTVNYKQEVMLGDSVKIYLAENEGEYYFRMVKDSGTVALEAQLAFDDIY